MEREETELAQELATSLAPMFYASRNAKIVPTASRKSYWWRAMVTKPITRRFSHALSFPEIEGQLKRNRDRRLVLFR